MPSETSRRIDAASLIAFPAERPTLGQHSREASTAQAMCDEILDGAPLLTHVWRSPYGDVGTILVPVVDVRLFEDRGKTVDAACKGIALAAAAGACCVSFTGMIPAATAYLRDVAERAGGGGTPVLTSGHAAVVAAFAFNVESILAAAGRSWADETVAFVGIGSIGTGILRLLDTHFPAARCFVVDLHDKRDALSAIGATLQGEVETVTIGRTDGLPTRLYDECSLFLTATSTPLVIDIDRLRPGSLLVDDSFPFGFDAERAADRVSGARDIRITIAGGLRGVAPFELVHVASPARRREEFAVLLERMARVINPWPACMTGCVFSALLTGHFGLPPTQGPVTWEAADAFYRRLAREGFGGTPPHLVTFGAPHRDAILEMPEAPLGHPNGTPGPSP